jgi:hypothetical protein
MLWAVNTSFDDVKQQRRRSCASLMDGLMDGGKLRP